MKLSLKLAKEAEIKALEDVGKHLSTVSEVEEVIFFGSRARGDFDTLSDIDLLIILSDIKAKDKVIGLLHDIELGYDVPLSPIIFTRREYNVNKRLKSGFIRNIEREGIVLYDSKHR